MCHISQRRRVPATDANTRAAEDGTEAKKGKRKVAKGGHALEVTPAEQYA